MEANYATIVYVESAPNVFIPNEWPIRGIESLVLDLVKKIITQPSSLTPILQVQNIPAKLNRRLTKNGVLYIFQKVSHEEVVDAYLWDVVLHTDDHNIKIENTRRNNNCSKLQLKYYAKASRTGKKIFYNVMPIRSNGQLLCSTDVNDLVLRRRILQRIKRSALNHCIVLLLNVVVFSTFFVTLS